MSEIDEIVSESQVRFEPPDDNWKSFVSTLSVDGEPVNALNVFLWDIRENRSLRSNERSLEHIDGRVRQQRAYRRLSCSYYVTAWSPAIASSTVEPPLAEHALLYEAVRASMAREPFVFSKIFEPTPLPVGFPAEFADDELPTNTTQPESVASSPDFWSTMDQPWRPALGVEITLPVTDSPVAFTYPVSSVEVGLRQLDNLVPAENLYVIGGSVLDSVNLMADGGQKPLANVAVRIGSVAGLTFQETQTNASGQFSFNGLRAGVYQLRARVMGRGDVIADITVPSATETYDIIFS